MKNRTLHLIFLSFGLSVLTFSVWRSNATFVSLALESKSEVAVESTASPITIDVSESDYSLLYPGLLPDHPLYFIKMIRDRVQLWFTRNPLAKAQLMLTYSDKRYAAALALAEKGKSGLAISTVTKAAHYTDRSLNEAKRAEEQGQDVTQYYEKCLSAVMKHQAVLAGIVSRVAKDAQGGLSDAIQLNSQDQEKVLDLLGGSMQDHESTSSGNPSELEGMDEQ